MKISIIIISLFLLPRAMFSLEYYVATTGSDLNPGTYSQPWRSFQKAANSVQAGDIVWIRGGIYEECSIEFANSGNLVDGWIVYKNYPAETPIIDGTKHGGSNGLTIYDKSYFKLEGLSVRNFPGRHCIWVSGCSHFEFNDLLVHNSGFGIGFTSGTHDFELNNVEIHHFTSYGFDATANGPDCYNGLFNDCIAHTCNDPDQNVDGFALGHGSQSNFTFNRCTVYGVYDGFDISANDVTLNECTGFNCINAAMKLWGDNVTVNNSIFFDNGVSNAQIAWRETAKSVTFRNCYFGQSETYNIWIANKNDALNMYNCILAGGDNNGLCFEQNDASNYRGDYNIFHNDGYRTINVGFIDVFTLSQINAGDWYTFSGQDAHSIACSNPSTELFIDYINNNFHLSDNSIAIDFCPDYNGLNKDYDGNRRRYGVGIDAGPYEKQDVCYENVQLQNMSIIDYGDIVFYRATNSATLSGESSTFKVEPDANIRIVAGASIRILPGFHSAPNSTFIAYIDDSPCSDPIPRENFVEDIKADHHSHKNINDINSFIDVVVYPNPGKSLFSFEIIGKRKDIIKIRVYNSIGRECEVLNENSIDNNFINLLSYPPGVYYLVVTTKYSTIKKTLIKLS